jgi:hypothetical protein
MNKTGECGKFFRDTDRKCRLITGHPGDCRIGRANNGGVQVYDTKNTSRTIIVETVELASQAIKDARKGSIKNH